MLMTIMEKILILADEITAPIAIKELRNSGYEC